MKYDLLCYFIFPTSLQMLPYNPMAYECHTSVQMHFIPLFSVAYLTGLRHLSEGNTY